MYTVLGGSCGFHRIAHASGVIPHRNTHVFHSTRLMPVPMALYTNPVCDSIGFTWAAERLLNFFKIPTKVLGGSCGFHRIAHAARVISHRNTHKALFHTAHASSYGTLYKARVRSLRFAWATERLLYIFKIPTKVLGGSCGFHIIAHAARVIPHRNTHKSAFHAAHANSYGAIHKVRVRSMRFA